MGAEIYQMITFVTTTASLIFSILILNWLLRLEKILETYRLRQNAIVKKHDNLALERLDLERRSVLRKLGE